jgi:O-methyltransferase
MLKQVAKRVIIGLGLEHPARYVWQPLSSTLRPVLNLRRVLKVRGWTTWRPLIPEEHFKAAVRGAIARLREVEPEGRFGDYLEFGVSRGTSMACVFDVLREERLEQVRLLGFDSFEGLPPESAEEGWVPGSYASTLSATRHYLRGRGVDLDRVTLVPGWFKDTLTEETRTSLRLGKVSLVMVDCDIFSASRDALEFAAPNIGRNAVVIFDDWDSSMKLNVAGQREAFKEFCTAHPDIGASPLPAYANARIFHLSRRAS